MEDIRSCGILPGGGASSTIRDDGKCGVVALKDRYSITTAYVICCVVAMKDHYSISADGKCCVVAMKDHYSITTADGKCYIVLMKDRYSITTADGKRVKEQR